MASAGAPADNAGLGFCPQRGFRGGAPSGGSGAKPHWSRRGFCV